MMLAPWLVNSVIACTVSGWVAGARASLSDAGEHRELGRLNLVNVSKERRRISNILK
jgi:hypothetical protein